MTEKLSFAVLAVGAVLVLGGGGAAIASRPDAQLAASVSPDPNSVYAPDPWPGRVVLGGEIAGVLGLVGVAVGLNGVLRAATGRARGS